MSVDVGIVHMGIVLARLDDRGKLVELPIITLVDLTKLTHRCIRRKDCKLHHSRELYDRLQHFYQEYGSIFSRAVAVLIERIRVAAGANRQRGWVTVAIHFVKI